MLMELSTDVAVDDRGLEAGVVFAKLYRGCHDDRVCRWSSSSGSSTVIEPGALGRHNSAPSARLELDLDLPVVKNILADQRFVPRIPTLELIDASAQRNNHSFLAIDSSPVSSMSM
jgi:hypothetical protein